MINEIKNYMRQQGHLPLFCIKKRCEVGLNQSPVKWSKPIIFNFSNFLSFLI